MPAPDIEALVLDGVRQQIASSQAEPALTDRELIERHVERVRGDPAQLRLIAPLEFVPARWIVAEPAAQFRAWSDLLRPPVDGSI